MITELEQCSPTLSRKLLKDTMLKECLPTGDIGTTPSAMGKPFSSNALLRRIWPRLRYYNGLFNVDLAKITRTQCRGPDENFYPIDWNSDTRSAEKRDADESAQPDCGDKKIEIHTGEK